MPGFTSHVSGTATGANSGHAAINLHHLAYLIASISDFVFWLGRIKSFLIKPCVCRVEGLLLLVHLTSATLAVAVMIPNYDRGLWPHCCYPTLR